MKLIREPWVMPCSREKEHDAAFPIELPERCIRMTTLEGDVVLDPFGGSGSTGVACRKWNRNYVLIEKECKYCELIKKRIESL
jgi:site-specific DNA-methyltransferase (adenine-specific)